MNNLDKMYCHRKS